MDSERHKQKAMEEAQRYEQAIPPSAPFGGMSHPSYCHLLERKKNHKKSQKMVKTTNDRE
jgi:hypothetical protein